MTKANKAPAPSKKPRKRVPRQPHATQSQAAEVVVQPQTTVVGTAEVVTPAKAEPPTKKKVKKAKKPLQKFIPKVENVDIECPSCSAVMSIPKLDKLQDVKCESCGLSGEIEV